MSMTKRINEEVEYNIEKIIPNVYDNNIDLFISEQTEKIYSDLKETLFNYSVLMETIEGLDYGMSEETKTKLLWISEILDK